MLKEMRNNSRWTILVVDQNPEYLDSSRFLIEGEGHKVLTTTNDLEALTLLQQVSVDLLLLEYFGPDIRREKILTKIRNLNPIIRIILQINGDFQSPSLELLKRLDIQGYFDKTEGPERLLFWLKLGLDAAFIVQLLTKNRQELQYILDASTDMHRVQPLKTLLQGILLQVSGLLGLSNSFLAVHPGDGFINPKEEVVESFLAMIDEDAELVIHAGTGCFNNHHTRVNEIIETGTIPLVQKSLENGKVESAVGATIVPLKVGETALGVIYLDQKVTQPEEVDLLHLFANQAAVAIQNAQFYETATIDQLTGVFIRGFFEMWFYRELRMCFRFQEPLVLILIDVDNLKRINDVAGHLAGDHALTTIGEVIRQSTRTTDILGRYGGDEFAILLPRTGEAGAKEIGRRILKALREKSITGPEGNPPIYCSLGLSAIEPQCILTDSIPNSPPHGYFETMSRLLLKSADIALYLSKTRGGNQMQIGARIKWLPFK